MELSVFFSDRYVVSGVVVKQKCLVTDFLSGLDGNYSSSVDGMLALIERISNEGLENISTKLCHEVDKQEKIYELIKGDIRVFFFKGIGKEIIICTTGLIKKTQKADTQHIEKAVSFRKSYFEANNNKNNKIGVINGK